MLKVVFFCLIVGLCTWIGYLFDEDYNRSSTLIRILWICIAIAVMYKPTFSKEKTNFMTNNVIKILISISGFLMLFTAFYGITSWNKNNLIILALATFILLLWHLRKRPLHTLKSLYKERSKNEIQFYKKYENKIIDVEGYIVSIDRLADGFGIELKDKVIVTKNGKVNFAYAKFTSDKEIEVAESKKGWVIIRGQLIYDTENIHLINCEFITLDDIK